MKFCVAKGTIIPEFGRYVASISVLLESTKDGVAYKASLPVVDSTELDADGVTGWRLEKATGLKWCNSNIDTSCAREEAAQSELTPGTKVTYRLIKIGDPTTSVALAGVKTASLTFRLVIGPVGGPLRSQTFTISDFPLRIVLAN